MGVNKRIVYLIIFVAAVVLVAELAWAYSALYKSSASTATSKVATTNQTAQISLVTESTTYKVGDQITVAIKASAPNPTDGVDVIINYDPKLLEVIPAATGSPIRVSAMYNQYPNNQLDATKGKITASGISSETGGMLANGVFGTIVFRVKASGTVALNIIYSPGATSDSNIIENGTGKDVLAGVENLQLNLTQ